jgi:hypothetical protein
MATYTVYLSTGREVVIEDGEMVTLHPLDRATPPVAKDRVIGFRDQNGDVFAWFSPDTVLAIVRSGS